MNTAKPMKRRPRIGKNHTKITSKSPLPQNPLNLSSASSSKPPWLLILLIDRKKQGLKKKLQLREYNIYCVDKIISFLSIG